MIQVKEALEAKQVQGVTFSLMETIFSPFFNIFDPQTNTFRLGCQGDEVMEGTTYDNAAEFTAALSVDTGASGIMQCK
jgi:hypothetical protein